MKLQHDYHLPQTPSAITVEALLSAYDDAVKHYHYPHLARRLAQGLCPYRQSNTSQHSLEALEERLGQSGVHCEEDLPLFNDFAPIVASDSFQSSASEPGGDELGTCEVVHWSSEQVDVDAFHTLVRHNQPVLLDLPLTQGIGSNGKKKFPPLEL